MGTPGFIPPTSGFIVKSYPSTTEADISSIRIKSTTCFNLNGLWYLLFISLLAARYEIIITSAVLPWPVEEYIQYYSC